MKTLAIKASTRTVLGKKDSKNLRRSGGVPCVLYGGKEPVHFAVPEFDFKNLVYTPEVYAVDLSVEDKNYKAVVRDIQFHPVTDRIVHIDFLELIADKPVIMDIPLKITGTAKGVREGGVLLAKMRKVKVKSLPGNLPDRVEINIADLGIGKAIRVGDVSIPNVEILDPKNNTIVAVKTARAVVEETPAAAAAATTEATPAAAPAAEADKKEEKKDKK